VKILVVSNLYPPFQLGGYEIGCRNVVAGLRNLDHDVAVITTPSHAPTVTEEPGVFRCLGLNWFEPSYSLPESVRIMNRLEALVTDFTNTSNLLDILKSFRPDCVYCFNLVGIGGIALLDALNTLDYPWVLHLMDVVPTTLQTGFSLPILSLFNAHNGEVYAKGKIVSMSLHLLDEIETATGISFENAAIVPGWADAPHDIIDREYCVDGNVKFVTAGIVLPHKGIDLILEAVVLLKSEGITNFTVEIYGDGNLSHYIDLCKLSSISNKISFLGFRSQSDLMKTYQSADVFLFPTWEREPFGFAPLEAASVGCVPIITATCGIAERLVGNVHCLKIKRDSNALFEAMKSICQQRIDLQGIGYNAQTIAREDLSFQTCLQQIEVILLNEVRQCRRKRLPTWSDCNLAFLKHNLAKKFLFSE